MFQRFWQSLLNTGINLNLSLLDEQRIRLLNLVNFSTILLEIILFFVGLWKGDIKLIAIMVCVLLVLNFPLYGLIRSLRYKFAFIYAYLIAHAILLVVPFVSKYYFQSADDSEIALIGLVVVGIILFDSYVQTVAVAFNILIFWVVRLFLKGSFTTFDEYYSIVINVSVCYFLIYVSVSFAKSIFRQYQALLLEKNEQLLRQAIDLQEANNLKNQLFAVVSHDLRMPLYNLQTTIKLLNEGQLSASQSKTLIKEIQYKTKDVNQLLSNLLNWANLQIRGYKNTTVEIPLKEIVDETLEYLEDEIRLKQLQIHNKILKNVFVFTDENQLQLILRNLISNAIKFTHLSGSVTIWSMEEENEIVVSVEDTGVGIQSQQLEMILSGKNKTSMRGTQGEKGNGLGLWLCREFIYKNGGRFWANSVEGQGSSFYFTLPQKFNVS